MHLGLEKSYLYKFMASDFQLSHLGLEYWSSTSVEIDHASFLSILSNYIEKEVD